MRNFRFWAVVSTIIIVSGIDYVTCLYDTSFDLLCRELYFIPVLLGAVWFGKKGALATVVSASALFLPCAVLASSPSTAEYVSNFSWPILILCIGMAIGVLRDRELRFANEKLSAVKAMAGAIEHELNNPLAIALVTSELIKEESRSGWKHHEEIDTVIRSIKRVSKLINKITRIDHIELMDYAGDHKIVDVEKSSVPKP